MGIEKPAIKTVAGFFHYPRRLQSVSSFGLDGFFFCTLLALALVLVVVLARAKQEFPLCMVLALGSANYPDSGSFCWQRCPFEKHPLRA